ncbi:dnaJ homolog subfamily C member 11-like [Dysidea avara]|uniref:dnaJ homolog subfamily C member 11-like n=1 Tax=Dysidea avara TaxID=196820 RepID=UPI0033306D26
MYESDYEEQQEVNCEYYTLLNVSKDASSDEVKSAYRRLCILYHPDKYPDKEKKQVAEKLFSKLKEAYEVLIDPRRRAIYDKRGKEGLENDLQLAERITVPVELMDEYEKFHKWWEDRIFIQKSNPTGYFKMSLDATEFLSDDEESGIMLEKITFSQSVDAQFSTSTTGTVMAAGAVSPMSVFGGLQFAMRHILSSRSWVSAAFMAATQPSLRGEFYHALSNHVYIQGHAQIILGPYGALLTTGVSLTHRISPTTLGEISVKDINMSAVKAKLIHEFSPKLKAMLVVQTGFTESYTKLQLTYHPVPQYQLTGSVKMATDGTWLCYGVDHEVAEMTSIGAHVEVLTTGGVSLRLRLQRTTQSYTVQVALSDSTELATILYATIIPLGLFACVKALALTPYLRRRREREVKSRREVMTKEMAEKKREAEQAIDLMSASLQRVLSVEQARHGLILIEAHYGKLFVSGELVSTDSHKVIDVRVPLQVMVKDSKLELPATTKATITGFYDPCWGEKKHLRVVYQFRGALHEVTVENMEELVIPRKSHLVQR